MAGNRYNLGLSQTHRLVGPTANRRKHVTMMADLGIRTRKQLKRILKALRPVSPSYRKVGRNPDVFEIIPTNRVRVK
jgi:hypothetical protein